MNLYNYYIIRWILFRVVILFSFGGLHWWWFNK